MGTKRMVMKCKGYRAKIEFDDEYEMFYGEALGIRDVLSFHGSSVEELKSKFESTILDYLELCSEIGKKPENPYGGAFQVRPSEKIHTELPLKLMEKEYHDNG